MSDTAESPIDSGDNQNSDVVVEDVDRADDAADSDDDDLESLLSEVDEAQFDDFDPTAVDLADRAAIPIDETGLKAVGVHKRKRTEGAADDEARKKKKKEGRREKPKRARKRRDGSEPFSGGEELAGKRVRKPKALEEDKEPSQRAPRRAEVDESTLSPEERELHLLEHCSILTDISQDVNESWIERWTLYCVVQMRDERSETVSI
jgi:transcription factor SPN1